MKITIFTALTAVFLASTAVAQDFQANEYNLTAQSGVLSFSAGIVDDDLATFEAGALVNTHQLGMFTGAIYTYGEYNRVTDELGFGVDYSLATQPVENLTIYGIAGLEYVSPANDLSGGDFFVTPTLGTSYAFTSSFSAFGEVGYTWNASNSWSQNGGLVEVGVVYDVTDNVSVMPSLTRTFDTGADATNFSMEVVLSF